jgi:hypothetical protein
MRQGLHILHVHVIITPYFTLPYKKGADQQSDSMVSICTCVPRRANLGLRQTVFGMLRIAKVTHLDQGSLAVV